MRTDVLIHLLYYKVTPGGSCGGGGFAWTCACTDTVAVSCKRIALRIG